MPFCHSFRSKESLWKDASHVAKSQASSFGHVGKRNVRDSNSKTVWSVKTDCQAVVASLTARRLELFLLGCGCIPARRLELFLILHPCQTTGTVSDRLWLHPCQTTGTVSDRLWLHHRQTTRTVSRLPDDWNCFCWAVVASPPDD